MDTQNGVPQGLLRGSLQTKCGARTVNIGDEEKMQIRLVIKPLPMLHQAPETTLETQTLDARKFPLLWQV